MNLIRSKFKIIYTEQDALKDTLRRLKLHHREYRRLKKRFYSLCEIYDTIVLKTFYRDRILICIGAISELRLMAASLLYDKDERSYEKINNYSKLDIPSL